MFRFYDPIGADVFNPSSGLWSEALHPYLTRDTRIAGLGQARNFNLGMNVLRCPTAPEVQGNDNWWTYGVNFGISYSAAQIASHTPGVFNYYQLTGNSKNYIGSRLLTRVKPTEFLVADILNKYTAAPPLTFNNKDHVPDMDADGDGILDTSTSLYNNNKPYGRNNFIDFRHFKGVNYVTADGSVHQAQPAEWFKNENTIW